MSSQFTVLLVDDHVFMLKICKQILVTNDYQVLLASSPTEAIQTAEKYDGEIHLLLTDVVMPEMNGLELSKQLSCIRENIKTLYMSAYSAKILSEQGIGFDGQYFINKPFTMKELLEKVNGALKNK